MRAKVTGVALAAVMACGMGGVQRASAAILNYEEKRGYYDFDAAISADLDNPGHAYYHLSYDTRPSGGSQFYNLTLTNATVTVDAYYNRQVKLFYFVDIRVYDASTQLQGIFQYYPYSSSLSDFAYSSPQDGFSQTSTITGGLTGVRIVDTVPLPASAPLFGAAILALGGISYASRRVKAKAA